MSTTPLWHKEGTTIDEAAMAFMSKDDVFLDRHLFRYDIRATEAHVRGLGRIDLMEDADVERVAEALHDLDTRFQSGAFVLDDRFEDGHSAIEADLTEHLGELGKRIHLGRSRNDQVAVALRLFMLDHLREVRALATDAQQTAEYLAKTHAGTPMPGYTHLQRAMPSSVDLWMGSFAEGFRDVAHLAKLTGEWIDSSPLGTAAGYGVPLPLDREGVAQELGFDRVQENPMQVQAARGRYEFQVLSVGWQALQEVRRLAWDLVLFSTQEFAFVTLGPGHRTGSSIMPNKHNPDMAELLRGQHAIVGGAMAELMQVIALPSGYQRDLQLTKSALIRGTLATVDGLRQIPSVLAEMTLNTEAMGEAIEPAMYMTEKAVQLAAEGMSFREAYRVASKPINVD